MMNIPKFKIGTSAIVQKRIAKEDTAVYFGSGQLDNLFGTPSMVILMIEAAVKAVEHMLPEELVTVGKYMEIEHQKPTVLGMVVSVKAELKGQNGNNLLFDIKVFDEAGIVGRGKLVRAIVNKRKLLYRANKRAAEVEDVNY